MKSEVKKLINKYGKVDYYELKDNVDFKFQKFQRLNDNGKRQMRWRIVYRGYIVRNEFNNVIFADTLSNCISSAKGILKLMSKGKIYIEEGKISWI